MFGENLEARFLKPPVEKITEATLEVMTEEEKITDEHISALSPEEQEWLISHYRDFSSFERGL